MAQLVSFEKQKLAAATILSAPFVPMLFMGEEFGEDNPFQYFISHGDPDLVKAVQEGRKREFEYFFQSHSDTEFPDPQAIETFRHSKINWNFKEVEQKELLFEFYKELLKLKKQGAFALFGNKDIKTETDEAGKILKITANSELRGIFNFGNELYSEEVVEGKLLEVLIFSADKKWGGDKEINDLLKPGEINVPAEAVVIYQS